MTAAKAADLPANPFGAWMAAKVSSLFQIAMSSDQIGVLAVRRADLATALSDAPSSTPPLPSTRRPGRRCSAGGRLCLGRAHLRRRDGGGPALADASGSADLRSLKELQ